MSILGKRKVLTTVVPISKEQSEKALAGKLKAAMVEFQRMSKDGLHTVAPEYKKPPDNLLHAKDLEGLTKLLGWMKHATAEIHKTKQGGVGGVGAGGETIRATQGQVQPGLLVERQPSSAVPVFTMMKSLQPSGYGAVPAFGVRETFPTGIYLQPTETIMAGRQRSALPGSTAAAAMTSLAFMQKQKEEEKLKILEAKNKSLIQGSIAGNMAQQIVAMTAFNACMATYGPVLDQYTGLPVNPKGDAERKSSRTWTCQVLAENLAKLVNLAIQNGWETIKSWAIENGKVAAKYLSAGGPFAEDPDFDPTTQTAGWTTKVTTGIYNAVKSVSTALTGEDGDLQRQHDLNTAQYNKSNETAEETAKREADEKAAQDLADTEGMEASPLIDSKLGPKDKAFELKFKTDADAFKARLLETDTTLVKLSALKDEVDAYVKTNFTSQGIGQAVGGTTNIDKSSFMWRTVNWYDTEFKGMLEKRMAALETIKDQTDLQTQQQTQSSETKSENTKLDEAMKLKLDKESFTPPPRKTNDSDDYVLLVNGMYEEMKTGRVNVITAWDTPAELISAVSVFPDLRVRLLASRTNVPSHPGTLSNWIATYAGFEIKQFIKDVETRTKHHAENISNDDITKKGDKAVQDAIKALADKQKADAAKLKAKNDYDKAQIDAKSWDAQVKSIRTEHLRAPGGDKFINDRWGQTVTESNNATLVQNIKVAFKNNQALVKRITSGFSKESGQSRRDQYYDNLDNMLNWMNNIGINPETISEEDSDDIFHIFQTTMENKASVVKLLRKNEVTTESDYTLAFDPPDTKAAKTMEIVVKDYDHVRLMQIQRLNAITVNAYAIDPEPKISEDYAKRSAKADKEWAAVMAKVFKKKVGEYWVAERSMIHIRNKYIIIIQKRIIEMVQQVPFSIRSANTNGGIDMDTMRNKITTALSDQKAEQEKRIEDLKDRPTVPSVP